MYLHSLTFQAVGPFPGRHTIDVAALGASGIFLLEGPTGAGKSTIIDAIVFALYGKVASREASEDRLRSGHARPEDETFVDLVFETGSGVYRVRRTPAYQRPKRRGTGSTLQQATARLWRLTSPDAAEDGDLVSNRADEVGGELTRIIGLDRAQFVQTVVLPQGEFASFLRANPEDRRGLLQKVFGTEVYEQVQQRLERLRAEAGRALEGAGERVGQSAAHFVGATGLGEDEAAAVREAAAGLGTPDADARLLRLARRGATAARDKAAAADAVAATAKASSVATQRALDAVRILLGSVRRRDGLRGELAELATQSEAHVEQVRRRAVALKAQRVWPCLVGADQAATAVAAAEVAVRRAREAAGVGQPDLPGLVDEATEPGVRLKTLAVERDACTAQRVSLARPLELEAAMPARRRGVDTLARAGEQRTAERDAVAQRLAARPEHRTTLRTRRGAAAAATERLGRAEGDVRTAERCHAAAVEVADLAGHVTTAEAAVQAARLAASAAVANAAAMHQARIAGIAAELAVELAPGTPCPVCGGTEHPRRAAAGPEQVTVEMVQAAEAQRSAVEGTLSTAAAALSELGARRHAALATAESLDVPTALARLEHSRTAVADAEAAGRERDSLDQELETFDAGTRELEQARGALDVSIATTDAELTGLRAQVDAEDADVAAARGAARSVRECAGALDDRIAAATAWMTALGDLEEALGRRAERFAELDSALVEHGFGDVDAVRAAALTDAELARLETAISAYEAALARAEAGLAEAEIADLPDELDAEHAEADLHRADAAHVAADAETTRAAGATARLGDRATSSAKAVRAVEAAVAQLARARAEAGPVVRMANVLAASGGDNAKQLSLATYVLARRFEDVVAAANSRLRTMSGGRYELARSEEREAVRTRRTGLAMKVLDHETGTERDPRTLSGGETFYVSLCLALGLADVVTAEAGGIDLGTLFIDEGFGSLDTETLDTVLAELGRLRDGGRVVGVVSHVEALKQTIAERIEVRRRPDGASTLTVRA